MPKRRRRRALGSAKKPETFVARSRTKDYDPAPSVSGAMQHAEAECKRGHEIVVRGEYTSDGSRWPGHRGRVVAVCENRRWRRY